MALKDLIKDRTRTEYMTAGEVAAILRLKTPRYVRFLLKRAGIKVVRAGYKNLLYNRTDINKFLKEREV